MERSSPVTYLQFHLVFVLPWIAVLGVMALRARAAGRPVAGARAPSDRVAWLALAAHVAVALLYTTPWDNYLVARGVWGYPEGRVWFTVGYVPIEEYLFFVLQTVLAGLTLFALLRRVDRPTTGSMARGRPMPSGRGPRREGRTRPQAERPMRRRGLRAAVRAGSVRPAPRSSSPSPGRGRPCSARSRGRISG